MFLFTIISNMVNNIIFSINDESVKINKQLYMDYDNRDPLTLNVEYVCPSIGYLWSLVNTSNGSICSIYIKTYDIAGTQVSLDNNSLYYNGSTTQVKSTLVFKGTRLIVTSVRGTAEASFVPLIYK